MKSPWVPPSWPVDIGERRYGYVTGGPGFVPWDDLVDVLTEKELELRPGLPAERVRQRYESEVAVSGDRHHWLFGFWPSLEPGRLLYHYTTMHRILDIAHGRTLRLGPLQAMNDPREYSYPSSAVLACFGSDNPDPPSEILRSTDHHARRGYLRPRMWDQYADRHTGVCLILDKTALDARIDATLTAAAEQAGIVVHHAFSGYVSYADDEQRLEQHAPVERALLTKDPDWESEFEYRWVALISREGDRDSPALFVNITGCVAGLALGARWPEAWMPVAESAARSLGVAANVARCKASGGNFGIALV